MFWGLQLEPSLRYSQQVPKSFRITKATLDADSANAPRGDASNVVQVFIEKDGTEYPIATLKPGVTFDCPLDLRFADGEDICFFLRGEGVVYLTGHELFPEEDECEQFFAPAEDSDESDELDASDVDEESDSDGPQIEDVTDRPDLVQQAVSRQAAARKTNGASKLTPAKLGAAILDVDDEDDDEDEESDFDEDDVDDEELSEDEDEDEDEDEEEEEEEEEVTVAKSGQKRPSTIVNGTPPDAKKAKSGKDTPSNNGQATPKFQAQQGKTPKGDKTPKLERSQGEKTPKSERADKTPASEKTPKDKRQGNQDAKAKSTPATADAAVKEIKIEDIRPGSGPVAKKGKTVHVYYTGRLMNGKKFDACTSGKPFSFKLGTGVVIQGWDIGLEGMKVGGKRSLVIPAPLAYGKKGTGPIPPNATLKFEVELKSVN